MTEQKDTNSQPPQYAAEDGKIDRHGEMTGAISVNMVFTMLPVTAWSFFIGPAFFGREVLPILLIALAMGVVLPFACLKLSRRIWAYLSHWVDKLN